MESNRFMLEYTSICPETTHQKLESQRIYLSLDHVQSPQTALCTSWNPSQSRCITGYHCVTSATSVPANYRTISSSSMCHPNKIGYSLVGERALFSLSSFFLSFLSFPSPFSTLPISLFNSPLSHNHVNVC